MKGKTFIVGTAIAIGAAWLYANRSDNRAAVAERRTIAPTVKVERSSNATQHVWLSPASTHEVVGAKPGAAAEPSPARDREPEPAQRKSGETLIEQFAPIHDALEAAFVLESHDGAWSMEAQRTAEASLSATLPAGAAIKSIDCRSTLCRIETTHDGYPGAKRFVNQLGTPAQRPWNGAFYTGPIVRDPGTGSVTFVTYLAREGAAMPPIPDPSGDEQAMR